MTVNPRRAVRHACLSASCVVLMPASAHAYVNCTSYVDPAGDVAWMQVRDDAGRLHFRAQTLPERPQCPGGEGCELPAFLRPGDQVIVTGRAHEPVHDRNLICGVYVSPGGAMTFGWLDAAGFGSGSNGTVDLPDPRLFGDWSDRAGATMTIRPGEEEGTSFLVVDGGIWEGTEAGTIHGPAFVGSGSTGPAAGYTDAPYKGERPSADAPSGNEDACRVRFRFTGYYLLVDENGRCSNPGLSLSGVYTRMPAKK